MNSLPTIISDIAGRLTLSPIRASRAGSLMLVALTCLPLLSACGGGDDDGETETKTAETSSTSSDSGDLCGLAILFMADPNAVCFTTSNSSSGSGSSSTDPMPPPQPPSSSSGSISIRGNVELEPNGDLMNANAVSFSQSDTRVGFSVDGTINDNGDIHDSFTFARPRSANFNLELCPPGEMICEQTMPIDTGTAFFEVLDQHGNIVKSSADDGSNFGHMPIEAGVAYYIRVVAGDTMGGTVGYTFTAYETN